MTLNALLENLSSYAIYKEEDFLLRKTCNFDTGITVIVTGKENRKEVKEKLIDYYGEGKIVEESDFIALTPVNLFEKTRFSYGDLVEIIKRLRDDDGCPWDRAQTPSTIRTNIIEEAYELIEAIDLDDDEKIREECGDVLLQGVFTAVMTEENGKLTHRDVITALCQKLISRHTHIFGTDKATDETSALMFWEKAKAKEKGQKSVGDKLDVVPTTFTALQKANKVQKIIKKAGFDFPDLDQAIDKIYEEVQEFRESQGEEREKEGGDMLFSVVNVLRMTGIDPEVALNGTTKRFEKRFRFVIKKAEESGRKIEDLTLDEMEEYYQQGKKYDE